MSGNNVAHGVYFQAV